MTSYDPSFFSLLMDVEDRHFWFRTRNQIILSQVQQVTSQLPAKSHILEVGCGTGNVLRVLSEACQEHLVVGMDLFSDGLYFAQQRTSAPLLQGDIHHPPFKPSFNLIGLFDVLEHLPNDIDVLCDIHKMLLPGGTLILTVPAHMSLWSYFDEASHHARRYTVAELETRLKIAGYTVQYCSQYMATLFPLVWIGRRLAALSNKSANAHTKANQEFRITPIVNELLTAILSVEAKLIARRWRLPIGTSLIAIASKPNTA